MSDTALDQFRAHLIQRSRVSDADQELLRHEMGATINRHRLTGRDEGMAAFNTSQLCWLVISNVAWQRDHQFIKGLVISALIDGGYDIFCEAKKKKILPENWSWAEWADGFSGSDKELLIQLNTIADMRERCGAVCLATRNNVNAIGEEILAAFCEMPLATVYHLLLHRALEGRQAEKTATNELRRLADRLEVLFVTETDVTLSKLINASTVDRPESVLGPFKDAAGELTRTAVAQRHLERGRPQMALDMIKDLRFLSPAYDQAIIIATLAALECGKHEMAEFYCRSIDNEDTRLKIVTRIAQVSGDVSAEVEALTRLYELNQRDAQIFVQLVNVLLRIGQKQLVAALCADAQERFVDDLAVEHVIRKILQAK